ncbi:DUF2252 domain-containing protein [Pseudonocardia sp.]|uniref:DUF2252 domain-containing protein n=1 Tax=Pseudonocardia sp. TaxID=60912 RepID=UPI003D0D864A
MDDSASSRPDSQAHGRALRRQVPRSAHAVLDLGPDRADPLVRLHADDADRVRELLPLRYSRMAASPFAFLRGSAGPMAADLARTPSTGLRAQLCGDAHLANFGLFASPERRLVFDLNDFDETAPGPWEWDVKRLAASVEVAARNNDFPGRRRRAIVRSTVARYREAMREFARMTTLDVWYAHIDTAGLAADLDSRIRRSGKREVDRFLSKARRRDNLGALARFAHTDDTGTHIVGDPPLVVPVGDLVDDDIGIEQRLTDLLADYAESLAPDRRVLLDAYRPVDFARKVVGIGSVGTRCWMILLLGRGDPTDPLFLQVKEAGPAVLEEHAGSAPVDHHGRRVVEGQRLMQAVSDVLLGWMQARGLDGRVRDYYVRQLRDMKGSLDLDRVRPEGLLAYAELCAWTLARAHARSGDRIAIAAYLGSGTAFDNAVAEFATAYADQTERDHSALVHEVSLGGPGDSDVPRDPLAPVATRGGGARRAPARPARRSAV